MPNEKKTNWKDLPEEFKTEIDNASEEQCRSAAAKASLGFDALMEAKAKDTDLAEQAEKHRAAGEQYREGTKIYRLKLRYIAERLKGMGKE